MPGLDNPFQEGIFPHIQPKPPLAFPLVQWVVRQGQSWSRCLMIVAQYPSISMMDVRVLGKPRQGGSFHSLGRLENALSELCCGIQQGCGCSLGCQSLIYGSSGNQEPSLDTSLAGRAAALLCPGNVSTGEAGAPLGSPAAISALDEPQLEKTEPRVENSPLPEPGRAPGSRFVSRLAPLSQLVLCTRNFFSSSLSIVLPFVLRSLWSRNCVP